MSVQIVGTFVGEFIECSGIITIGQIAHDLIADLADVIGINGNTCKAVT